MKRLFFIFIFFAVFVMVHLDIAHASTIRISSPKNELTLEPGQIYSGEIVAENPDPDPAKLHIYAEDWFYAPGGTGEKKFSPAGTTPFSASKWITFTPSDATLLPFGKVTAHYRIVVPEDAKGAFFSVLFFESALGTAQNEEGVNVLVAGRVGALFFIHVKGTVNRQGEVTAVKVAPPEGNKPMEVETTFKNTGNVDIALSGNLLILENDGAVLGRADINKIYTFPGSTASGKTQWVGRLPKGSHQLLLTYDLGEGKTLVKEETVSVS